MGLSVGKTAIVSSLFGLSQLRLMGRAKAVEGLRRGVALVAVFLLEDDVRKSASALGSLLAGGLTASHRPSGPLVYSLLWLWTIAWAFWEVGLDGWALVPRIVAPTVLEEPAAGAAASVLA